SDDAGHFVLDRKQTGEVGTESDPGAREIGGVVCPEAELRQVEYAARLGYGSGRRGLRSAGDTHQQRDIGDRAGHEPALREPGIGVGRGSVRDAAVARAEADDIVEGS